MYKLTLKKASGYIKSRKVVVSLEFHEEHHWWVNFSWLDKTPKFFTWFYFANLYFNKLVEKYNLDVEWIEDKDEVADIIKSATKKKSMGN